jgi:membrane associated rhomboid family serine protease
LYGQRPTGWSSRLPFADSPYPWTLRIVVLNLAVFGLKMLLVRSAGAQYIESFFWLQPVRVLTQGMVWQLLTYMFFHAGLMHIGFNMFLLWMMGREVELTLGSAAFLRLYFVSGIVAGLFSLPMLGANVLGASGAVLGILAAYGSLFPDRIILAFMIIPMKVKHFIWVVAALDLYGAIVGTGNIAHLAHIGGLITGLLMIKRGWYRKPILDIEGRRRRSSMKRLKEDRERINELLDKVSREGLDSLSKSERTFLESMRNSR